MLHNPTIVPFLSGSRCKGVEVPQKWNELYLKVKSQKRNQMLKLLSSGVLRQRVYNTLLPDDQGGLRRAEIFGFPEPEPGRASSAIEEPIELHTG